MSDDTKNCEWLVEDLDWKDKEIKQLRADLEAANEKMNRVIKTIEDEYKFKIFGYTMILDRIHYILSAEAARELEGEEKGSGE